VEKGRNMDNVEEDKWYVQNIGDLILFLKTLQIPMTKLFMNNEKAVISILIISQKVCCTHVESCAGDIHPM
jgi:hypothetical protein